MRRIVFAGSLALALAACGTSSTSVGGDPICTGSDCVDATDGDAAGGGDTSGADAGGDASDDATETDTGGEDAASDVSDDGAVDADLDVADAGDADEDAADAADAAPDGGEDADTGCVENGCGGCTALPGLGAPCGECLDGVQVCDGTDALRCEGDEDLEIEWWVDADGDGYGNDDSDPERGCAPPPGRWTDRAGDCDDLDDTTHVDADEVCDGADNDCDEAVDEPPSDECADACCDDDFVCVEGFCTLTCEGDACGRGTFCCDVGDVCWGDEECLSPGGPCRFTEECALDEFCDRDTGLCLPDEVLPVCEYRPPVGEFTPELACRWRSDGLESRNRDHVVATPIVVNLTDDNGDGRTDADDVPEIVAIGHDGSRANGTVAFTRVGTDGASWRELWRNDTYPRWGTHTTGGALVSLADLDADGAPEVIIGNVVLNGEDGSLAWDGVVTSGGEGGIGINAFLGPSGTVADIDLDGDQEVIAGNTVYSPDGTVEWTYEYTTSNSRCGSSIGCDGFNAVGNFDDDPEGEVVSIRRGEVFVIEHDGTLAHRIPLPVRGCSYNESGPPTVADFDGDGRPEIGTASADYYVVADLDCDVSPVPAGCDSRGILWKQVNEDCSSRATGSSVFDFEGDGRAEVVYADETTFRIFDGQTGTILFEDATHGSHTRIEMPVIADVDNDGNAEIVIPENGSRSGREGIDVWADTSDNWVRTRRIWNQHGYSVTNITESGAIPALPEPNWSNPRLNNFRQNVQPAGLFNAPDMVASSALGVAESCPFDVVEVVTLVANEGALAVSPGLPVRIDIYDGDERIGRVTTETTTRLGPGVEEILEVDVPLSRDADAPLEIRVTVDPDGDVNECDEDNNTFTSMDVTCYLP